MDVDAVYRFLSEEAYWARGRTREAVQQHVAAADRVVGFYDGAQQVWFTRTALVKGMPYLFDVYVLAGPGPGPGLGTELVRETVERGPFAAYKWLLDTDDAHGLYARFGSRPPRTATCSALGRLEG